MTVVVVVLEVTGLLALGGLVHALVRGRRELRELRRHYERMGCERGERGGSGR